MLRLKNGHDRKWAYAVLTVGAFSIFFAIGTVLLVKVKSLPVLSCLFPAIFPPIQTMSETRDEHWGGTHDHYLDQGPENSSRRIVWNIVKEINAIHQIRPEGDYNNLKISEINLPESFPFLNKNYEIVSSGQEITFHVRATPRACSETAHYLLDDQGDHAINAIEINGFKPEVETLAIKVVDSCKSGKLIVKVP